ncbi:MAG: hypothetical protein KIT75_13215 [Planctomycetota bacterium]|nr:hypothetical protein [Planctomycetota bacterium]MCW8136067.1 hypothetical protein [Planctomycetota bacterium]MCW8136619.1 hypothetical protein [Planctomycetota bacterium]
MNQLTHDELHRANVVLACRLRWLTERIAGFEEGNQRLMLAASRQLDAFCKDTHTPMRISVRKIEDALARNLALGEIQFQAELLAMRDEIAELGDSAPSLQHLQWRMYGHLASEERYYELLAMLEPPPKRIRSSKPSRGEARQGQAPVVPETRQGQAPLVPVPLQSEYSNQRQVPVPLEGAHSNQRQEPVPLQSEHSNQQQKPVQSDHSEKGQVPKVPVPGHADPVALLNLATEANEDWLKALMTWEEAGSKGQPPRYSQDVLRQLEQCAAHSAEVAEFLTKQKHLIAWTESVMRGPGVPAPAES